MKKDYPYLRAAIGGISPEHGAAASREARAANVLTCKGLKWTPAPQRLTLSRKKGFNLQRASRKLNGLEAVNCSRPSRYGNPFVIKFDPHSDYSPQTAADAVRMHAEHLAKQRKIAPILFRAMQNELRGKNLACFCKLDQLCHVDTLLKLANE